MGAEWVEAGLLKYEFFNGAECCGKCAASFVDIMLVCHLQNTAYSAKKLTPEHRATAHILKVLGRSETVQWYALAVASCRWTRYLSPFSWVLVAISYDPCRPM